MALPPPLNKEQFEALLGAICTAVESPENQNKSFAQIVDVINFILITAINQRGGKTSPSAYNFSTCVETEVYSSWITNIAGFGIAVTMVWGNCKTCIFTAYEGATPVGNGLEGYVSIVPSDFPSGRCSTVSQGFNGVKKFLIVKPCKPNKICKAYDYCKNRKSKCYPIKHRSCCKKHSYTKDFDDYSSNDESDHSSNDLSYHKKPYQCPKYPKDHCKCDKRY